MKVKVIKTKTGHEAALVRTEKLMEATPNTPRGDELELLSLLVPALRTPAELFLGELGKA